MQDSDQDVVPVSREKPIPCQRCGANIPLDKAKDQFIERHDDQGLPMFYTVCEVCATLALLANEKVHTDHPCKICGERNYDV